MSTGDTPWEPPLAGTEVEHLLGALERMRATFRWKAGGLDAEGYQAHVADAGVHASLRRLICDLVEEYGRHTGHADLLREAVDGLVGEDPPPGWTP
ncbi:DUF664 domain-containing protein [Georgenia sp. AZ-5]|uniref:mycothiol transferase n=1 Tax=Georgenia sp. AZ-5 TaxID=3367526 RepID=UPI0037552F1B